MHHHMEAAATTPRRSMMTLWMHEPRFRWASILLAGFGLVLTLISMVPNNVIKGKFLANAEQPTFYTGQVGELQEHRVCLWLDQQGDSLHGLYWYTKWAPVAEKFEVWGRKSGDRIVLYARLSDWNLYEVFTGRVLPDGTIEGVWCAHDHCKRLPFRVTPSDRDVLELQHQV
jgi:hypothetical protein